MYGCHGIFEGSDGPPVCRQHFLHEVVVPYYSHSDGSELIKRPPLVPSPRSDVDVRPASCPACRFVEDRFLGIPK